MICIYQSSILCDLTSILVTHLGLEAASAISRCLSTAVKVTVKLHHGKRPLCSSSFLLISPFFVLCFFHPFISFSISVCYTPLYHLHPSPPSFPPCPPLSSVVCNLWKQLDLVSRAFCPCRVVGLTCCSRRISPHSATTTLSASVGGLSMIWEVGGGTVCDGRN